MYFLANGSKEDITDVITDTNPFISEYIDNQNIIHKFIVGGEATEDYYGYVEYLFTEDGQQLGGSGWFGNKILMENDPEWLKNGKELIGILD